MPHDADVAVGLLCRCEEGTTQATGDKFGHCEATFVPSGASQAAEATLGRLMRDLRVEHCSAVTKGSRTVYTAKLAGAVYLLQVFQKKSTHGIATPRHVTDLILRRLRGAAAHHADSFGKDV